MSLSARDYMREVPNLHLEFHQRDVTDDAVTWEIPVDVVSKIFREMVKVAQKPENAAPPVIKPIFHSSAWRMFTAMRHGGLS